MNSTCLDITRYYLYFKYDLIALLRLADPRLSMRDNTRVCVLASILDIQHKNLYVFANEKLKRTRNSVNVIIGNRFVPVG